MESDCKITPANEFVFQFYIRRRERKRSMGYILFNFHTQMTIVFYESMDRPPGFLSFVSSLVCQPNDEAQSFSAMSIMAHSYLTEETEWEDLHEPLLWKTIQTIRSYRRLPILCCPFRQIAHIPYRSCSCFQLIILPKKVPLETGRIDKNCSEN